MKLNAGSPVHSSPFGASRGLFLARLGDLASAQAAPPPRPSGPRRTTRWPLCIWRWTIARRRSLTPPRVSKWTGPDGPPYCWHRRLEECPVVLHALDAPEPSLPPFDAAKAKKLPYEDDIRHLQVGSRISRPTIQYVQSPSPCANRHGWQPHNALWKLMRRTLPLSQPPSPGPTLIRGPCRTRKLAPGSSASRTAGSTRRPRRLADLCLSSGAPRPWMTSADPGSGTAEGTGPE